MRKLFFIAVLLVALPSCTLISGFLDNDQVVAKVGHKKLHRSQVEKFIPELVSVEDSARLAEQYIRTWAADILYIEEADASLSKAEKDVTGELEDFRRSLLRYRYEQKYVAENLDTAITEFQFEEYYTAHQGDFILTRPIMKTRFVNIIQSVPEKEQVYAQMSSSDSFDIGQVDTLARRVALKYVDRSDVWMDAYALSVNSGIDYDTLIAGKRGELLVVEPDGRLDALAIYICDIRSEGIAPLEYCKSRIRDVIISNRKRELLKSLEQDLLENARKHNKFVIYGDEE